MKLLNHGSYPPYSPIEYFLLACYRLLCITVKSKSIDPGPKRATLLRTISSSVVTFYPKSNLKQLPRLLSLSTLSFPLLLLLHTLPLQSRFYAPYSPLSSCLLPLLTSSSFSSSTPLASPPLLSPPTLLLLRPTPPPLRVASDSVIHCYTAPPFYPPIPPIPPPLLHQDPFPPPLLPHHPTFPLTLSPTLSLLSTPSHSYPPIPSLLFDSISFLLLFQYLYMEILFLTIPPTHFSQYPTTSFSSYSYRSAVLSPPKFILSPYYSLNLVPSFSTRPPLPPFPPTLLYLLTPFTCPVVFSPFLSLPSLASIFSHYTFISLSS